MISIQRTQVFGGSRAAGASGAAAIAAPRSFVAMMYHNVCADAADYRDLSPSATSYFVRRDAFEQQIAELGTGDISCMTLDELRAFYAPPTGTETTATTMKSARRSVL